MVFLFFTFEKEHIPKATRATNALSDGGIVLYSEETKNSF